MRVFLYLERLAKRENEKGENQELIDLFSDLVSAKTPDERLRQAVFASFRYLKYLKKGRPQMIALQELKDNVFEQSDAYERAAFWEFFSNEYEEVLEKGRVQTIYEMIFKNYRRRHNADISEKYAAKINGTNYYPALEDIQYAAWTSSSPKEFEREVDSILNRYLEELGAVRGENN